MNLTIWDWTIVGITFAILTLIVLISNRYTKNVADYLAAGRGAGRFMMVMASGMVQTDLNARTTKISAVSQFVRHRFLHGYSQRNRWG